VAVKLRIIYGGSVNDKNADELASQVWLHCEKVLPHAIVVCSIQHQY
jgi:hypothetical protein